MYIHENRKWSCFQWKKDIVNVMLNAVNRAMGYLMGRYGVVGKDARM